MNESKFKTFLVKDAMGKIVRISNYDPISVNEYLIYKF